VIYLVLIAVSFCLSWAGTAVLRRVLARRAMLDQPNERSLHTVPVPRGGGLAVVGTVAVLMIAGSAWHNAWSHSLFLILPLLALMAVSWLDDRGSVAPVVRLAVHLLAALTASFIFLPTQMLFDGALPFWLDRMLMIIGWAWFMNLYNFMDGIDGITGVQTISISLGTIVLIVAIGLFGAKLIDPRTGIYAAMLIGAAAGFLVLNWHPAKIFLGDIGSVPLGFLAGFLLLSVALQVSLIPALIIPLYYLADSGITLVKRLLRGEKIWQAHRQHFYQQAALRQGRHDVVVAWIIGGNLLLIGCATAALVAPWLALAAGITVTATLLFQLHRMAHS
jgi:UDP-N-acetylmuramyl pentapeptide phosphotransferase/UDP-N-acetylglucosamine-1-phosphate transferase